MLSLLLLVLGYHVCYSYWLAGYYQDIADLKEVWVTRLYLFLSAFFAVLILDLFLLFQFLRSKD